jgi:hypothetical protein
VRVLNVGGGGRDLPPMFKGWDQTLLDIDPAVKPDLVCDAKDMHKLPSGKYDAVYTSHMLEHFYRHDVPSVLGGFSHVLKPTGFAYVIVPDLGQVLASMKDRDILDTLYMTSGGAVTFHDVLYGWNKVMAQGNLFFAHKCGFTEQSLSKAMLRSFAKVYTAPDGSFNLHAYGFKQAPKKELLKRLGV